MKKLKDNQYFQLGRMILIIVCISALLLVAALNFDILLGAVSKVFSVLSPLITGCVFAYLLNPLVKFMDRRLYPLFCRKKMKAERAFKLSRAISLVFALLIALILVYEFFAMLLPQLYESVLGIVNNFNNYYAAAESWILGVFEQNPELRERVDVILSNLFGDLGNWLNNDLMGWLNEDVIGNIGQFFSGLTTSVLSVVGVVMDLLIGLVASIYILWSKDTFIAQSKKIIVAVCKEETADHILDQVRRTNKVFSGFIIGKLVDSLIIGVLCYIGMLILKLPYPALIATVIGVTNVIPFFGPFIGAIPSAFLILLVNPLQCLYFVIFVLVLQQLDGNVIGPRILGDTVGISGFWVLVSITVAGGLFGFAGMLLGVPVFAVLYMLVTDLVHGKLRKKEMPVDTEEYRQLQQVSDLNRSEASE